MACSFLTQRLIVASLAPACRSVALGTSPPSPSVHAATRVSSLSSTSSSASKVVASIASSTE
jgi:hypothetical protein